MLSIIIEYLKKPVTLKTYQVTALCLGCAGFLIFLVLYDRAVKKSDQYGELNTFLESRIKELHGERTQLEKSLNDAIENALNQQIQIEQKHEKDLQDNRLFVDSISVSENERLFKKRFGPVRQYKKR